MLSDLAHYIIIFNTFYYTQVPLAELLIQLDNKLYEISEVFKSWQT